MGRKTTEIEFKKNPEEYDLIVLCTPIWAGNLTPAMRTYLKKHDLKGKKVAISICSGGLEQQKALDEMKELTSGKIVAILGITKDQVKDNSYKEHLVGFVKKLV
jgi:hypothetical protein